MEVPVARQPKIAGRRRYEHGIRLCIAVHRGHDRGDRGATLAELDKTKNTSPIMAEMLEPVRKEYQARLERAYEEIRRIHLDREEIRREELQSLRQHLILTEKQQLADAFREGQISRDAYEELLAETDARLMELESQETPPPPPYRGS